MNVTGPTATAPIQADQLHGTARKRQRLAARCIRLLVASNGDAGQRLAELDDVELPQPFGTWYRAAASVVEDGEPLTFDTIAERFRASGLLAAVGGYRGIEALKRGDDAAPGPSTLAESVEELRAVNREIDALDVQAETLRRAGFGITVPEVDGPPVAVTRPATSEQIDPPVASWPDPPAAAAYHGTIGEIVRALEPHTEGDPTAILAQLLIGLGNLIGSGPYYRVEGTEHRLNEFLGLVGNTAGGRKGTSWDQARRVLAAVDDVWARERVQGGLASGEGAIHAVRDKREERKPVMEKGRVVDYTTVETDAGITDKRLLSYEPELARVLRSMIREGSTLSTIIRQAWDGPHLRVMAKSAGAVATGAHISIIAHITGEELARQLQETEAASGFGNRFLWLAVRRSKLLPDGGNLDTATLAPLLTRLRDAVSFARRLGQLTRDPEARALWRAEYPRLTAGKPGLLGSMTARSDAHTLRLSLLYAVADKSPTIKRPHLQAALALWDYSARSAAFIFGDSLGDPMADELLRALRAAPDGLTRTEMREHFGRNKSSAEIGRALAVLARQSLAACATAEPDGPGRPPERWRASRPGEVSP